MSMLVFFPWLRLKKPVIAGGFTLVPYERGRIPAGPGSVLQNTLDAVTAPYLSQPEQPIQYATLVQVDQEAFTYDLDEDQRGAIFVLSELLAVCGLSCRKYFQIGGLGYWNRDNFRLVVQAFADPQAGVAMTTRRRDGSTTGYWSKEYYRVQRPEHVFLNSIVHIDERLLEALLRARDAATWDRFWEPIVSFNLANTDNMDMAGEVEAVLLSGAFERLLECNRGKEDDLAECFTPALVPTDDLAPSVGGRLSSPDITNRFKKSTTIRDIWIRDFFRLRGNLAHGKVASRYRAVWSLRDHLLLASFAFPLLLKSVLAKEHLYTLSEADQFQIDMFELLACEEHFVPVANRHDPDAYPWNQVFERAMKEREQKHLAEEIRKLWDSQRG